MGITLRTDTAWNRITELARSKRRGSRVVAVPYLGAGAAKRLPLRQGDLLVTRFDDGAFKSGVVDPKEVVKYLRREVEVHAVANLHAKVFVFGDRALVGSTNVSDHSAKHLIEAVCESDTPRFVAAAVRFVKSLRGDQIGIAFARQGRTLQTAAVAWWWTQGSPADSRALSPERRDASHDRIRPAR